MIQARSHASVRHADGQLGVVVTDFALLAAAPAPADAATLYWSGNASTQGGAGTWNTTDARFGSASSGLFTTVWNNTTNAADTVLFGGATSNATLGTNVTVRQLTFNNASTVTAGGFSVTTGLATNLTAAAGGSSRATGGTITAPIVGTNGLTISGTVSFSDPASFGVDDVVSLDASVADGTYTLIAGNVITTGLANLGPGSAFDLGSGKSASFQQGSLQITVVPEPTTTAGVGLAIAMLARVARRQRGER